MTSHDQSNLLDVYRPMNRLGYSSQLPPSPSPTMMVSDDDCSLYSPKSPHTPHHSRNNSAATNYYMNTLDPMVHQ